MKTRGVKLDSPTVCASCLKDIKTHCVQIGERSQYHFSCYYLMIKNAEKI